MRGKNECDKSADKEKNKRLCVHISVRIKRNMYI
jgi:hypothetical protein